MRVGFFLLFGRCVTLHRIGLDIGTEDDNRLSLSDADEEQRVDDSETSTLSGSDDMDPRRPKERSSTKLQDDAQQDTPRAMHTNNASAAADGGSNKAPPDTWLGIVPALRDGPQQQ